RALDLSRNLDGLLNAGQMPILYPLIGALVNLERHSEADREFQYAVRVAQSAWGSTDPRVIRPVDRYAHWLEHMGRYPSARAAYARELTLAEGAGSRAARLVIDPLLGIARSYRLETTNGSDEEAAQYADPFAYPSSGALIEHGARGLNRDGHTADVITNSSDATAAQQKIVLAAVRRARYAPRLLNGEPVDTEGVTLLEKLLSKRPRQP